MTKYKALFLSFFLFIIIFLIEWYSDFLFDKYSILYSFASIHVFCFYIMLLLHNIAICKAENKKTSLISIFLLIVIGVFSLFFPTRKVKTKLEFDWLLPKRMQVIELVKNNELPLDEMRNGKLPKKLMWVSTSGEVTVYQNDKENIEVGFWIFRGMLSGSVELIYSEGKGELIKKNETGHKIISIEKIKENWYYVITEY